jgi:glycosyltransferase involved in cell wall biosynthesis
MVRSIKSQTFENWELLIIDDASTDATREVLQHSGIEDGRISIVYNHENKGANYCRNQGLELARSQHIIFFDADDLMTSDCLETRKKHMEDAPNNDMWIFNMGLFKRELGDVSVSKFWIAPSADSDMIGNFLKHNIPWSIMQTVWKKRMLTSLNGFDLTFKKFQDVEMHTRALLARPALVTFPALKPDVFYRIDEARKNFKVKEFYLRTVEASTMYYQKFYPLLSSKVQQKQLTGTLFQPLANICWQKRLKTISKEDYEILKNNLISTCKIRQHRSILKLYQQLESLSPVHPKGLKKIFQVILGV